MTSVDPRTPVIVGAGQINHRELGAEPIDLMARSVESALGDAATSVDRLDAIRVVWGVWPYRDPGRLVAERIGASDVRTTITTMGGHQVYDLITDTATRIQRGQLDTVIVCGAETLRTRRHDHRHGRRTAYVDERNGSAPDERFGSDRPLSTEVEHSFGVDTAVNFYAMAETALRHVLGETIEGHRQRIAELWADASAVAVGNPDAWTRDAVSAAEIATESASNRPVASPYPKLMTSNLNVDQGGAVLMCSAEAADRAGIPREGWVFPRAGVGAADHPFATNRWAFVESPAMRLAGRRALDLARLDVDDCAHVDLYSCFPAAVQIGQRELGVSAGRPFTITGGLTFAAGPLNCYCLLPLVRAVGLLRDSPTDRALLTGNGGFFRRHSMLVLGGEPNDDGFRTDDVQSDVDALPSRPTPSERPPTATVETYTVRFGRDRRPDRAILACLDAAGARHWATIDDAASLHDLLTTDRCESMVSLDDRIAHLT